MSQYNSADLLARVRRKINRPEDDVGTQAPELYVYLSNAQEHWIGQLGLHVPNLVQVFQKMTRLSDREFQIPSEPRGAVELFENRQGGGLGAGTVGTGLFRWEGVRKIVFDSPRTFSDGPYALFIPSPPEISASSQPVLQPAHVRRLLVPTAAAEWAREGGLRDPAPYENEAEILWAGDPHRPGDVGILGELKKLYGGVGEPNRLWWRSPDLSYF